MSELSSGAVAPRTARLRPTYDRVLYDVVIVGGALLLTAIWIVPGVLTLSLSPSAALPLALLLVALFLWHQVWRGNGYGAARRRARLRLHPLPRRALRWVAMLSATEAVLQLSLESLVSALDLVEVPPDQEIIEYLARPWGWTVLLVVMAMQAPLVEEFFLRGRMQGHLERRLGPAWAIGVTAAVFSALHLEPHALANHFAGGVVLGFAVYATRSIWAGVLLHAAWNGLVLLRWALFPNAEHTGKGMAYALPSAAIVLAAVAGVFWAGRRLWDQTRGRARAVASVSPG